jgi:hypothetical protein
VAAQQPGGDGQHRAKSVDPQQAAWDALLVKLDGLSRARHGFSFKVKNIRECA